MSGFDVLVAGRSLSALAAALDLAELGLRVLIAGEEASDALSAAAPERDAEGAIVDLMRRVSTPLPGAHAVSESSVRDEPRPERVAPVPPLLRDGAGAWQLQPEPNVWGIPAEPVGPRVTALIGGGGAFRAYRDRIAPLLTVGKTRGIGRLVQKRMGGAVLAKLTQPLIRERYGVSAEAVDVAVAAPGLNEALTRAGSLGAAVSTYFDRHAEREATVVPEGGWSGLETALVERLRLYGAEFSPAAVVSVEQRGEHEWSVQQEGGERHEVRAVVLDQSAERLSSLPVRVHAEIDIDAPSGIEAACSGLMLHSDWSLRVFGAGRAEAWGPRVEPGAELDPGETRRALEELLAAAGVRPRAGAVWAVEHRAAAYATVEERQLAVDELEAEARRLPTTLRVGRALHGDDLSATLAAAHRGAIGLRRRLLGIAEGE